MYGRSNTLTSAGIRGSVNHRHDQSGFRDGTWGHEDEHAHMPCFPPPFGFCGAKGHGAGLGKQSGKKSYSYSPAKIRGTDEPARLHCESPKWQCSLCPSSFRLVSWTCQHRRLPTTKLQKAAAEPVLLLLLFLQRDIEVQTREWWTFLAIEYARGSKMACSKS